MIIPERFKERMRTYSGVDAERLFAALESEDAVRAFRVNDIKISTEDFLDINPFDAEKIPYSDNGFYTTEQKPGNHPYHKAGMIYMQDPSAQISLGAIDIKAGWRVLDACASPGGKATQASACVGDGGVVVANEYVTKRCRILEENVSRLGCRNTVILNLDTKYIAQTYKEFFDLVICDAPCSGEGMFRKNIAAVNEWSEENIAMCAERQFEILENCAVCVAPDGYLLYSTCTFSMEEDECNVKNFLDAHDEFELCPVNERIRKYTSDGIMIDGCEYDMTLTRRFYPYVSSGEGQFVALMHKKYSCVNKDTHKSDRKKRADAIRKSREETEALDAARRFLRDNMQDIEYLEPVYYNGKVYLSPDVPRTEFGIFSLGVLMGECRKGRIVPSHHLFSALGHKFKNRIFMHIDDERVEQYLNGHEIYDGNAADGWGVIMLDGAALGGVKVSGGACKNHYLK